MTSSSFNPVRVSRTSTLIDIPSGLKGKFGIVKLWPGVKAAEDEIIERVKRTARSLGLECVSVDFMGRPVDNSDYEFTQNDLDFIIHLHFETPKSYDIFSFVALWNPLQFYHEWGYRRFSSHLATHDDFLSCSSPWADDQAKRLVSARDSGHLDVTLRLYHSLSEPIFEPAPPSFPRTLFYAGINWDKLKGRSRHQEILELLDAAGLIRIFGPRIFQGVNVWEGFKGYSGPIPFDGESMIAEIARAGVSLVFSSQAHKESGLMSARLFESAAAGAVIIADENPFARKHFGDTILYVDSSLPVDDVFHSIKTHLTWIRDYPERAHDMAQRSQNVFLEKFALDRSLTELYAAFPERKRALRAPSTAEPVTLGVLLPSFSPALVEKHLKSIRSQDYEQLDLVILANKHEEHFAADALRSAVAGMPRCEIRFVEFERRNAAGAVTAGVRLGQIINDAIEQSRTDLICIVAPHEHLFSDHLRRLAALLGKDDKCAVAASDLLLCHRADGRDHIDLCDTLCPNSLITTQPVGFGRFLLRRSNLPKSISVTLPYLNALSYHAVAGLSSTARSFRPTARIDIQNSWWTSLASADVSKEWEILGDVADSDGFQTFRGPPGPATLLGSGISRTSDIDKWVHSLSEDESRRVARLLFASLPLWDVLRRPFETIRRLIALRWPRLASKPRSRG